MQITIQDGRVFSGLTAVEVVAAMRALYNRYKPEPLTSNLDYIAGFINRAAKAGHELKSNGSTELEICEAFLRALVTEGMAKEGQ